jgi:hypothetical protein
VKLSRASIALYMGLVFASGAVLGVFGTRYYNQVTFEARFKDKGGKGRRMSPEEYRRDAIRHMKERLSLTPEQETKLGLIYDETRAQFDALQRRIVPEQQAIGDAQTDRIREMLSPAQREEYEEMRKEREQKMRRKDGRGFGPGPGF